MFYNHFKDNLEIKHIVNNYRGEEIDDGDLINTRGYVNYSTNRQITTDNQKVITVTATIEIKPNIDIRLGDKIKYNNQIFTVQKITPIKNGQTGRLLKYLLDVI